MAHNIPLESRLQKSTQNIYNVYTSINKIEVFMFVFHDIMLSCCISYWIESICLDMSEKNYKYVNSILWHENVDLWLIRRIHEK